jgi:hypothetical protein
MSGLRSLLPHVARAAFAPAVAIVAWLAFPQALGNLPPRLEVGAVAPDDIIAARGFVVTKTEAERARQAEDLAASVMAVVRSNAAAAAAAANCPTVVGTVRSSPRVASHACSGGGHVSASRGTIADIAASGPGANRNKACPSV